MWRGPGTGPPPPSQWDSLSPKKMYAALGGAGGKVAYWEHGEREVRSKQTDWGDTSDHFLSRWADEEEEEEEEFAG